MCNVHYSTFEQNFSHFILYVRCTAVNCHIKSTCILYIEKKIVKIWYIFQFYRVKFTLSSMKCHYGFAVHHSMATHVIFYNENYPIKYLHRNGFVSSISIYVKRIWMENSILNIGPLDKLYIGCWQLLRSLAVTLKFNAIEFKLWLKNSNEINTSCSNPWKWKLTFWVNR